MVQFICDFEQCRHDNSHLWGESMKKNILVKVGERTETRTRTIPAQYDETGNRIAEETIESYEVTVPVMQAQTVEMAAEDIAAVDMEISPEMQIQALKNELAAYDYIGTKIAMGVATREEYAEEIAHTETLRQRIRTLESEVG